MKLTAYRFLICALLLFTRDALQSQTRRVIVNTADAVYELTGAGGTCTYVPVADICPANQEAYYSTALYNQTLYFISLNFNNLYSVELGSPGSCRLVTSFPKTLPTATSSSVNAMTVDKAGILYGVDNVNRRLYRCNPYTKETVTLGVLPVSPGGDLVFYGDKLLLATSGQGLYEIDLDDPAASKPYMNTGAYTFWGLISFPFDCINNKVYGFAPSGQGTDLVELDLENKIVGGVVCSIPIVIYDAASIVETGNTLGIWIDSILIQAPCNAAELTGNAQVMGYSATPGDIRYTLSTGLENTTGKFQQLDKGTYQVKMTNQAGCTKDTSFTIMQGMAGITATGINPLMCELPNGSITIDAFSNYPITVHINEGAPDHAMRYTGLGAGVYNISVIDGGSCRSDSTIVLLYDRRPDFLGAITTQPTSCEGKSGSIDVAINGDATEIMAALDGGPYQPLSHLKNLDEGTYRLAILNTSNCHYDTLVHIGKVVDPPPQVTVDIADQFCFDNNGKVIIHASGFGSPFTYSINHGNYFPGNSFERLAPGAYALGIRNSNSCLWDSLVEIKPYIQAPVNFTVSKKDPNCAIIKSGELQVNISGAESPYTFNVDSKTYAAGELAYLAPGKYPVQVFNRGGCMVDTTSVEMILQYTPECNRMSMPNAFSPNNDGNNDVFRPIHSPYITQVQLTIYNRYGQVVFRSSPMQPGWDGMLGGRQAETGSYAWVLTYRDFNSESKKMNGLVLVLR